MKRFLAAVLALCAFVAPAAEFDIIIPQQRADGSNIARVLSPGASSVLTFSAGKIPQTTLLTSFVLTGSLGTGVATFLVTPTMANANAALSDGDYAFIAAANIFTNDQTISGKSLKFLTSGHIYSVDNISDPFTLVFKFDGTEKASLNNAGSFNASSFTVAGTSAIDSSRNGSFAKVAVGLSSATYALDVSGTTGSTARFFDQTATTGDTKVLIQAGAGQTSLLLAAINSAAQTVFGINNSGAVEVGGLNLNGVGGGNLTGQGGFDIRASGFAPFTITNPTLNWPSGANQRAGNLTLIGGTKTISNTAVTANTVVLLTRKTSGGTIGTAITYTLSAGVSFTVTSDNILDTSTFSYLLIEVP